MSIYFTNNKTEEWLCLHTREIVSNVVTLDCQ